MAQGYGCAIFKHSGDNHPTTSKFSNQGIPYFGNQGFESDSYLLYSGTDLKHSMYRLQYVCEAMQACYA